jgi:hypothetical protein
VLAGLLQGVRPHADEQQQLNRVALLLLQDGVTIRVLVEQTMIHNTPEERTTIIQHLLNSQKVKVFSDAANNQYYKLNTQPPDTRCGRQACWGLVLQAWVWTG